MSRVVKIDSHLGDSDWVGKLVLRYYTGGAWQQRVIPFFENPSIVESQNPRYMNYAPIARSSNLFAYLGADSRKFNLSFRLTLPNITAIMQQYSDLFLTPPTKVQKRKEILEEANTADRTSSMNAQKIMQKKPSGVMGGGIMGAMMAPMGVGIQSGAQQVQNEAQANIAGRQPELDKITEKQKQYKGVAAEFDDQYDTVLLEQELNLQKFTSYDSPMYNPNSEGAKLRRSTINTVASLVASIRSTVVNSVIDPQFGPPLVRLDWGILYRDVPCVCKGYTINVNDKGGYDKKTLLPRVIEVTMNLEEARNLQPTAGQIQADDLVGWEVLMGTEQNPGMTMDPGNFKNYQFVKVPTAGTPGGYKLRGNL